MSTPSRSRRSQLAMVVSIPVLVLALIGCTSAGSDGVDPSPTTGTGPASGQPMTDAEWSAARDDYDRKLAQCFRDQGLDVKDPKPGEGIAEDSPEIQAAFPACSAEIGDPPSSEGIAVDPAALEKALAQAKCLRELGYEIQEPTVDDIGFIPAEVAPEDFETCRQD